MLGAQARAAELQAAKSAALRQRAHRDSEEQNIPAQSTAVLLTDFARNPLQSKNKGTKAYRPLIDSDFDIVDHQNDMTSVSSASESFDMIKPFEEDTRSSAPPNLPTAPRAMRNPTGYASSNAASMQSRNIMFWRHDQTPQAHRASRNNYTDNTMLSPSFTEAPQVRPIFGPDDLSPTKQEIKFAEMRQLHGSQTSAQYHPIFLTHNNPNLPPQESHAHELRPQQNVVHTQLPFDPYLLNRSQLAHHQSEAGTSSTGVFLNQFHLERTQSFADDVIHHQTELHHQLGTQPPSDTIEPVPESDRPYDRNSKMQSFVAAQQAMARKGKTVLHNPELYKSSPLTATSTPPAKLSSAVQSFPLRSYEETPKPSPKADAAMSELQMDQKSHDMITLHAPEERLSVGQTTSSVDQTSIEMAGHSHGPSHVWAKLEEWCTLRPITFKEREKMLRITRDIAAVSTIHNNADAFTSGTNVVGSAAQDWLSHETMHAPSRRSVLDGIVDEHYKRVDAVPTYGAIGKPFLRESLPNIRRGPLKPVANIMAMLHQFGEERRLDPDNNEYTMAPEYAIDRSKRDEPMSKSLFDDHANAMGRF